MFIDPYATRYAKQYKSDRIKKQVAEALINNDVDQAFVNIAVPGGIIENLSLLVHSDPGEDIEQFTQPLIINRLGNDHVVLDGRPFITDARGVDKNLSDYRVRQHADFMLLIYRGVFTDILVKGATDMSSAVHLTIKFFEHFITSTIVTRLNLRNDFDTQKRLSILCYLYYLIMSSEEKVSLEDKRTREFLKLWIVRNLPYNAVDVDSVLENIDDMDSLEGFCANLYNATQNPRLKTMKADDLYTLVAGSWFGINAREIIGVALEHVPTFMALVYSSLTDRSFRKCVLASRITTFGDRNYRERSEECLRRLYLNYVSR